MNLCCKEILCDLYSFKENENATEQHYCELINAFCLMNGEERLLYFYIKKREKTDRLEIYGKMQDPILFSNFIRRKLILRLGEEKWFKNLRKMRTVINNGIWIQVKKNDSIQ